MKQILVPVDTWFKKARPQLAAAINHRCAKVSPPPPSSIPNVRCLLTCGPGVLGKCGPMRLGIFWASFGKTVPSLFWRGHLNRWGIYGSSLWQSCRVDNGAKKTLSHWLSYSRLYELSNIEAEASFWVGATSFFMQSASFWNKRSFFRILCALNFDGGISISISCNTFSLAQFGNIFALHACIQVKLRPKTKKTMPNQQLQTRMGMARTNANLQSILQKRTFPCSHVHTFPNTNTTTSLRQITKHTNKKKLKTSTNYL